MSVVVAAADVAVVDVLHCLSSDWLINNLCVLSLEPGTIGALLLSLQNSATFYSACVCVSCVVLCAFSCHANNC